MKRKFITHASWGVATVLAFAGGHWWPPRGDHSSRSSRPNEGALTSFDGAGPSVLNVKSKPASAAGDSTEGQALSVAAEQAAKPLISESEIQSLVVEAITDANPLKRSLAFSKLLESLTPENALTILEALRANRADGREWDLFRYACRDPKAASEYLVSMPDSPMKDSAVSGFARRIVREDPEAAMAWASTIAQDEMRLRTLTRAARDWFERDAAAAMGWLDTNNLPAEVQNAIMRAAEGERRGRRDG